MLLASLRDLQHRARRFSITVIGTALVFALTMVLAGLSSAFGVEVEDTVAALQVDGWVTDAASSGPLLTTSPIPDDAIEQVRQLDGVTAAGGVALGRQTIELDGLQDVIIFGAEPGAPGMPAARDGREPTTSREVMASSRLGLAPGDQLRLGEHDYEVVGTAGDLSVLAGVAAVFVLIEDAQELVFAGLPAVGSVAYTGSLAEAPEGFALATPADAEAEFARPVESARSAVTLVSVLLWLIAGLIIGSVVYLSVLERESDFAVYKATGWSNRALLGGVVVQALIIAELAAVIGAVLGTLLAPIFPMRVEIGLGAYLALPLLAALVSLLASAIGLRRITNVDPAAAFG